MRYSVVSRVTLNATHAFMNARQSFWIMRVQCFQYFKIFSRTLCDQRTYNVHNGNIDVFNLSVI